MNTIRTVLLAIVTGALGLSGCATTKPTSFYMLQPIAAVPADTVRVSSTAPVALGVGPIELPHYTDRPEIVTRGDGNRLDVAEFSQWGEPLDDNVTRVLAENLSMLLPTQKAEVFPWKRAADIDYQVTVEVSRFDSTLGGDAVLTARWQIRDDRTENEIVARKSSFTFPSVSADHAGAVAAMNRAVDALSVEINETLISVAR